MDARPLSLLLVEDDEVVRMSLRFALESPGIVVAEAGTLAEGERCFRDAASDVAVIDLHLPDGDGYDLAARLWRLAPRLPLVLISTDPDDPDGQRLPAQHGRSMVLAKPFSASQLLDAIALVTAEGKGGVHA